MAEYALAHAPAWNTVYASQIGDGTATFWANSFLPLWGRFCNVARYLVSSGTVPTSGPSLDTQGALVGDPDGTTLIGWSGFAPTPQSTLRGVLETIITQLVGKVGIDGSDTMTGALRTPEVIINDGSKTVTLLARAPWRSDGFPMPVAGQWEHNLSGETEASALGAILPVKIFPPHGNPLGSVSVSFRGGPGHVALPASMPTAQVWLRPHATGILAPVAAATTDGSGNVGAYQSVHTIVASGGAHVVDRDANQYFVIVTNESGANALVGAAFLDAKRISTITRMDEG